MFKYLVFFFSSLFLHKPISNERFQLVFYDENNNIVMTLNSSDFKTIDWNNQCYTIKNPSGINQKRFEGGRMDFSFDNKTMLSVHLFDLSTSAAMPQDDPFVLVRDGRMLSSGNQFCISAYNDKQDELLKGYVSNTSLVDYLKQKKLVFNY